MSHIKTFARLKPSPKLYEDYEIRGKKTFSLRVPELLRDHGIQAGRNCYHNISYDFQFDRIFDTTVNQEEVYNAAARDIVTGFLDGYNGTIFAYGQTGTGKTYTVEGSPLRYSNRGLAPRALTEIYKSLEKREDEDITLSISYLEIYQEVAYDLLSTTARTISPVTVFPRVTVVEGCSGSCTIRNLSMHLAPSEDVASALMLQGQANRKVAETPVNQRSSRSHAVFTIYLTAKKQQSDIITRSKLHLVDLAGSERVAKTGVDGQQLTEAKSINLSLHYLESVIIALQADSAQNRPFTTNSRGNTPSGSRPTSSEGGRRHVPYRNSLLTMVLRDSLGGNCQTSMIATISLEVHNLGETLSTCRFAQRVACISNHARRNEEVDDKTLIQQLKRRVAELETQMACLKMSSQTGESGDGWRREEDDMTSKLTDEDKLYCAQVVQEYLAGRIIDPITAGITNPFKFRECLRILKRMVMTKYFQDKLAPARQSSANRADILNAANHVSGNASGASQNPENDRGVMEMHGNTQILRLDNAGESATNTSAQTTSNVVMDTDELILGIQRLHAASCREQRSRPQGTTPEQPSTPPKMVGAHPETYKSPYERKREKEIRKLSRRLETLKQRQTTQEQQLQDLRMSTAFGELSSMETILKNKIQVTREQLADQHAYILHLRHTEASPDILQQEKLVEDQLIKREAKFQKKLDEVLQKKSDLEAQATQRQGSENKDTGEGQGQTKASRGKRSLEDQFFQYKKRNGTLNTRQVFDMLKLEERKHTKVSHQAETEKKLLMSKQLAHKEEATREKLRELKEMMRKSREEAVLGQDGSPYAPISIFSAEENPSASCFGAWVDKSAHMTEANGQSFSQTFVVEKPESKSESKSLSKSESKSLSLTLDELETSMTQGDDSDKVPNRNDTAKPGSTTVHISQNQHPSQLQPSSTPSRISSRADLKWESAYSRPSTSHSMPSQQRVELPQRTGMLMSQVSGGGVFNNLQSIPSPELMKNGEGRNGRVRSNSNSSGQSVEIDNVSPELRLSFLQDGEIADEKSDKQSHGNKMDIDKHSHGDSTGVDRERYSHNKKTSVDRYEQNHHDRTGEDRYSHKTRDRASGLEDLGETYSPTVMPSEYVHSMNGKEKFDARKMGLSSKTFDSALSSMLNDESKTLIYGFEYYNKFARETKPPVRKGMSSQSPERHTAVTSHRSAERRTTAVADLPKHHVGTFSNAWGPEVKNSSIAKRLAQFLSDDKDSRSCSSTEAAISNKTTKSVSFLERLTQPHDEPITSDTEVTSPRIQALQDTQRESTYMGRIQAEKERVAKIRQARQAAEAIQRAWRHHCKNSK